MLFGLLPLPGYVAISLQRRPSSLRGPPGGNEVGRGEGGYINPKTSTFNTHRTSFASFFRSTRIKATQLNSLSFAFTRHRSSDTMVAFKLATLLAVATAVAAYPGGLLTRSGTCSTGTLNCCNSIQVRTSFLTLKLFFCTYSCPPQTACWLRQLCRLGRASPDCCPGVKPSHRRYLVRFHTYLVLTLLLTESTATRSLSSAPALLALAPHRPRAATIRRAASPCFSLSLCSVH